MPVPRSNPRINLAVRNAECELCRLCVDAEGADRCVTAVGNHKAKLLVVSKRAPGERQLKEMHTYLERAGINPDDCVFTGANKCRTWDTEPNKTDIKACRVYLAQEIDFIKPEWVLCLGNEAMLSATGKSGIMKHRGITYPAHCGSSHTPRVVSTISPAMVHRNPGHKSGFEADLTYVARLMSGHDVVNEHKPKVYRVANTREDLYELRAALRDAHGVSFDIESTGFDEFAPDARVVCVAFTIWGRDENVPQTTWALPLYHPESPWRRVWKKVLAQFAGVMAEVPKRIAHNGKFDCRWLRHFGWPTADVTFDTMIAAHVLDENRPKGLKPLARTLLGAPPWAIETHDLLNEPLDEVLEYCGLDTFHAARLYFLFREELLEKPNARKARLFSRLLMPAANEFIAVERAGVWVDQPTMMTNWRIAQRQLDEINAELRKHVPDDHPFVKEYRDGTTDVECNINFGPSNFLRWFLFEYLELPVLARGKVKDDGSPGAPSVAESVMLALKPLHPVIDLLLDRTKWYKYTTAFFSAYSEQLDSDSRIHTTFKVVGTVTGRLSSGKADADKVTGRKQIRGANLQQVPRDSFVRGIFGAPPGSRFVEFDYSQIELRIAAELAQERTMLALYDQGADIHMAMAMRLTGLPQAEITKHMRKMAKAVNFGFLYGMGWLKFIGTALQNYEIIVSEADAKKARTAFFDQFPGLLPWHAKQRALAHKYKRVETPLGRVRHLPDIDSPDQGVRAEAERQAINSPVQGLASDLALLSFVRVARQFRKLDLRAHAIGTVHDAINFEIPDEELPIALPLIKNTMEQLPLERLFGIRLSIPIIADCKVGTRWGGAQELTEEQVNNFDLSVLEAAA